FFGDITYEESEISWIEQGDVSALFTAYPQLEHFCVRGGNNLNLGTLNHANLKSLIIQTGGLSREVVAQVCRAELPALEHLELWLGVDSYGGDCEVDDLRPLLQLGRFPALRYLGLKDSMLADAIAEIVADAPVLEQLEVLDLSMGVLGDAGAEKLISSPAIRKLKKIVLRHHYMSNAMVRRWSISGITADVSDQQKAAGVDDRYVEVSE
ncbi:MAG: STM4015 family protein, partial [Cyanobacteria bacterium]|nr:STM4015 family protein [Cyanobacteriota bacterium]